MKVLTESSNYTAIADAIREQVGSSDTFKPSEMATAIRSVGEAKEFNQMNDSVTAYLAAAESAYTDSNYSGTSVVSNYASADANHDDPRGYDIEVKSDGTLYLFDETEPSRSWSRAVTAGTVTVYNLIPTHTFTYTVITEEGACTSGRLKPTGKLRQIYYGADDNARDLGGFACDGGTVNYGLLFRGAGVGEAAYKDILVNQIGVCCEIDLQENADTPLYGVDYHRFGLVTPSSSYAELYALTGNSYLATMKALLEKCMQNAVDGIPTYIHCSRGTDRTGLVCFYLQAILGMSGKDLDINYEATCLTGSLWGSSLQNIKRTFAPWTKLRQWFDGLYTADNLLTKILYWSYSAGIDVALINKYRAAMSSGTPATVSYADFEVKYVNQIPISTDTDGSVYGWKKDYRLDSGGNASGYSGFYLTGFIPVKAGDVVRLQGVQHRKGASNASNQRLSVYTSAKAHIAQGNANYPPSSYVTKCSYNSSNDLVQFTVAGSNVAYFRICGQLISNDSIITVNEEIV